MPDKETPRCPISEMSVTRAPTPPRCPPSPLPGCFAPRCSSCLALFLLFRSRSLFSPLFRNMLSVLICLVSLGGVYTRSKTRTINSSMKLRYRTNERIYHAIMRMKRSSRDRLSVLKESQCSLPPRGNFECRENFANYERKNMRGYGNDFIVLTFFSLPPSVPLIRIRMQNAR